MVVKKLRKGMKLIERYGNWVTYDPPFSWLTAVLWLAPFLFIGVLGAFTTFSTYSLETLNLLRAGKTELTLLNVGASNGLCLLAVYAGFACSRLVRPPA